MHAAAAQLMERHGEAGFNTNAVAERAGVSVGTLYRCFASKEAVLLALARRETAMVGAVRAAAMERPQLLASPDFEDELVLLARSYTNISRE